jgi:Mg-chelatase subunit ChlD
MNFRAIYVSLILCLFFASIVSSAYAVPALEVDKTLSSGTVNEGDPVTVTLSLDGTGTPSTTRNNLDVMILLDKSWSMNGSKFAAAKDASTNFVGLLDPTYDRAGLVGFSHNFWDDGAHLYEPLTSDFTHLQSEISDLDATLWTQTNTGDSIIEAYQQLTSPTNVKVAILLSDGEPTVGSPTPEDFAIAQANIAAAQGIVIYTISLGGAAPSLFYFSQTLI